MTERARTMGMGMGMRSLAGLALVLCAGLPVWAAGPTPAAAVTAPAPTVATAAAPLERQVRACTACHGDQGRAGPDGYYPRIAGKPAGYLYNQLLNFREGRRSYPLMTRLIDPLSEPYLLEIAQHFAALHPPYPPPAAPTTPVSATVLARGRTLALQGDAARRVPACAQCHGTALTGALPATPGLLGLPLDYLNAQLGAWQTGQRRAHAPDCMAQVVERLSNADLHAVATWLSMQPVPADARPAARPPAPAPGDETLRCGSALDSPGARR